MMKGVVFIKRKYIVCIAVFLLGLYPGAFLAYNAHIFLSGERRLASGPGEILRGLAGTPLTLFLFWALVRGSTLNYKAGVREVIPGVKTPLPSGENQYGSARWLAPAKYKKAFWGVSLRSGKETRAMLDWLVAMGYVDQWDGYDPAQDTPIQFQAFPRGGLVVGQKKNGRTLFLVDGDTHSITLGATRSSKSRSVVLPSVCVTALSGESMILVDLKGELYSYTAPFLRRLGYEVVVLDFEHPEKSSRYNFLQPIVDFLERGDIAKAKAATWELVETLVGDSKGEPIWHNGECSIIACCIMAVAYDNRNKPQYQNLANVYHFISRMCAPQPGGSVLPLQKYLWDLPEEHPAKSLAGITNVAHVRTRSSFYTSALATLRLFEDHYIADMTGRTDFDLYATGVSKRALFIILPDEKSVYYSIASLFVAQHYQILVATAKENGGRLPRRVEFFMDEAGNFTYIPAFSKQLTVGGGRGIRFHLFLQAFKQLDEVYGENISSIIRSNCETWLYLQSDDPGTLEILSKKLGDYTTKSPNLSASLDGYGGSASYGYMGRNLLTPDEVGKINRPYQLVTSRSDPAILYAPDVSKTVFNRMMGLGDEDHNKALIMRRSAARIQRRVRPPELWGVWKQYEAMPQPQGAAAGGVPAMEDSF